jgi:hypothetical protein
MTDQEKIARIVKWMGGWPEHKWFPITRISPSLAENPPFICSRCIILDSWEHTGDCRAFNPFTRIEDAMMVVERLEVGEGMVLHLSKSPVSSVWIVSMLGKMGEGDTPARAIAETAYQVIDNLTKNGRVVSTHGAENET